MVGGMTQSIGTCRLVFPLVQKYMQNGNCEGNLVYNMIIHIMITDLLILVHLIPSYNTTEPTLKMHAFQLLRYHQNPLTQGIEHASHWALLTPVRVHGRSGSSTSCYDAPRLHAVGSHAGGHSSATELHALATIPPLPSTSIHIIGELRSLVVEFLFV